MRDGNGIRSGGDVSAVACGIYGFNIWTVSALSLSIAAAAGVRFAFDFKRAGSIPREQ
jgi:hypothetical protein